MKEYKIRWYINDVYEVVEYKKRDYGISVFQRSLADCDEWVSVFQGSLADCEAFVRLNKEELML